ncbi:MAG TPA: fumarylacetoacetate hydrolase family protein [Chloroflexota bacterium]|nr:fumarylacetoacetate hydrolase family protein [Chloroflexota bacterium]
MKLIRFLQNGRPAYGVLHGADVYTLEGNPFTSTSHELGLLVGSMKEIVLLPPCVPTKIIAVGLNYRNPAQEGLPAVPEEPIISFKPPSSVIGTGEAIVWPRMSTRIDFEGELAVIIGRNTRNVSPAHAREYIFGFTCSNDVTARDVQRREGQWAKAKGFYTFCPLGPCIATDLDPAKCQLITRVNGETRQATSTGLLHFSACDLVSYISKIMTLVPGDVILTGTPAGSGPLKDGDVVEVEIEGVGTLRNPVRAESSV